MTTAADGPGTATHAPSAGSFPWESWDDERLLDVRMCDLGVRIRSSFVLHNFKWGQASLLIAILALISYRAFKRNNHVLSALTLALASSIKIIPAFFLLFYIVNWKKGLSKLLLWFTLFSSLALLVLPLLSLGYKDTCNTYKAYYRMMTAQNKFISFSTWNNQTATGILFRYFSKDYAQLKSGASFPPFPHRPPRFLPIKTLFTAQRVQTTGIILSLFILIVTLYLSRRKNCHPEMLHGDEHEDMRFCLFVSGFFLCAIRGRSRS